MCANGKHISHRRREPIQKTGDTENDLGKLLPKPSEVFEGGVDILFKLSHAKIPKKSIKDFTNSLLDEIKTQLTSPEGVVYRLELGRFTDSPRDVGVLTVRGKDGSEVISRQLIKKSHGEHDAWASREKTKAGLFPKSIYEDRNLIVEELVDRVVDVDGLRVGTSIVDRGPLLDGKEPEILGRRLARVVYNEFKSGVLYSVGYVPGKADTGRIPETHIKVTGRGYGLKVSLIDWGGAVNLNKLKAENKLTEARNAFKEHIKMLTHVIRGCLNDGADARAWESFRRTLAHDRAANIAESDYFHGILGDVRGELADPATWGGDQQAAQSYRRFFDRVSAVFRGAIISEKPVRTRERLVNAMTQKRIKTEHAKAIIDDLASIIPSKQLFGKLNFTLQPGPTGDVREGYGILTAMGPEPARKVVGQYEITVPKSLEHAMVVHRASESEVGLKVVYKSKDAIVRRHILDSTFTDRRAEISKLENAAEVWARVGERTARKLGRMVYRNIMTDRDPKDYPKDTLIVEDKKGDFDVLFTGWEKWLNLSGLKVNEREELIKNHLRGIYEMFKSVPHYSAHAWGAFESTLVARARRADMKEMYGRILDKFKTEVIDKDLKAENFFKEASESTIKTPARMPDEIRDALVDAKFKNPGWAWDCITQMSDWGPEQEYAYGFTQEEDKVKKKERRESFTPIALKLIRLIKESDLEPDGTLRNLRRIGTIYDRCGARVYRNMAGDMRPPFMFDKRELYEHIKTPEAIAAITYPVTISRTDGLAFRGPYLAKIFLETLVRNPEYFDQAINVKPESKDALTLKREVNQRLREVGRKHGKEGIESLTEHKVGALRRFAHLEFLRLGYMYTELMLGRPSRDQIEHINTEVSNLSNVLLQAVYETAKPLVDSKLGAPTCSYAIILGGANARREFPTFDYDMIGVYERGGKTDKGESHAKCFNALHTTIGSMLQDIDHHADYSISLSWHKTKTIAGYMTALTSLEHRWQAKAYIDLIHGAGDEKLSAKFMKRVKAYVNKPENRRRILAQRYYDRIHRNLEEDYDPRNIKIRPGGLRDVLDVTWMYKLKNKVDETNVMKLLEMIREDRLRSLKDSEYESESKRMDKLLESYGFMMNLRIRMDILAGRNDKFLPEAEDLHLLARGLRYDTDEEGRAEDKFMKDYERHTKTIRNTTNDLITWMFTKKELVDMERLGMQVDSNITRAVGFAPNGSPITIEDIGLARRLEAGMKGFPKPDETGRAKFIERRELSEHIRAALDHLRGSHFNPKLGRYERMEDWLKEVMKVEDAARKEGERPPRYYKDRETGRWVYGIPPKGYYDGD